MKGYLLSNDGCHYTVKANKEKLSLFYSKVGQWTSAFKGKRAFKLTDTGNDFILEWHGGKKITLDICQLAEFIKGAELFFRQKPKTFTDYTEALGVKGQND